MNSLPHHTPQSSAAGSAKPVPVAAFPERRRRRPSAARYHLWCDHLTEGLLYALIIFSPWAFGTTQPWSIRAVNAGGYLLGILLVGKWGLRRLLNYQPHLWTETSHDHPASTAAASYRWAVRLMAILTCIILAFCLISALNPRAYYDHATQTLRNVSCIAWLPHSYDPPSTWMVFWQYLGVAAVFWAVRDWLLVKSRHEVLATTADPSEPSIPMAEEAGHRRQCDWPMTNTSLHLPSRLKRLLWVLCINGALLALEGILQRLDGTNRLLWLVEPRLNQIPVQQFGPYAYRSNGAQYLNLIWPVCLGFWYYLSHGEWRFAAARTRIGGSAHTVLLPCAVLVASAPVVSSSRGGALVAGIMGVFAAMLLALGSRRLHRVKRLGILATLLSAAGLGVYLGWANLKPRVEEMFSDNNLGGRRVIYQNARPMAEEHPWFGTGPGTFCTLYQFYREDPNTPWFVMAHDDWLETRITFGWVGSLLVLAGLLLVMVKAFLPVGIGAPGIFKALIGLSLAGCLFHAKFDFPFQVLSILLLFTLLCSMLFCLARRT